MRIAHKLLAFLVTSGVSLSPIAQPAPAASAASDAHAASAKTSSGTTFAEPGGWTRADRPTMIEFTAPEGDLRIALVDVGEAADAKAAAAAAWQAWAPGDSRPPKLVTARPARNGWDERQVVDYETSPNEKRAMQAIAQRVGRAWLVALIDGSDGTAEKRLAAVGLVLQSLRPAGYARETFAGRTAHPMDAERIAQLRAFVEKAMEQLGVPGASFALTTRKATIYSAGLGVRSLRSAVPVDADTEFMIASNTKGLSTLLLARLVDERKVDWDQPAVQAYPAFRLGSADTTAKVEKIFAPLGMTATTFDDDQATSRNWAEPNGDGITGKPTPLGGPGMALNRSIKPFRPAGGAWSSANDLVKYVRFELNEGRLDDGTPYISSRNVLQRRVPNVSIGEDKTYGMGLENDRSWGVDVVHHGGSLAGYKSDVLLIPSAEIGAVLLTSADNGQMLLRPFMRRLLELLYDGQPEAANDVTVAAARNASELATERARVSVTPDRAAVAALAHRYASPQLGPLKVTRRGNGVTFEFRTIKSPMGTRKNDDGTLSFVSIDPTLLFFPLVVGKQAGKPTLRVIDSQHEYTFTALK